MPLTSLRLIAVAAAVAVAFAACASPSPSPPGPAPAASGSAGAATSVPAGAWAARFDSALAVAERYRAPGLDERRFTHAQLWQALEPWLGGDVRVTEIGRSLHGREIRAVTLGSGPVTVLLWSQMHGDEATATMAIADLLRWYTEAAGDPRRERLARELTVVFVPMLNPDGAELFQRENAAGVDVNRDARRLATPEGRALKALRDSLRPAFGFNLHDQNARTRAGRGGEQVAIALLAPAFDEARSYDAVRSRARLVAAALAQGLGGEIGGRIAKYDDSFTPRAFGDLMQQWGTSTVLIESGALPNDPQKQRLRVLNAAALLMAFDAIATGDYAAADPVWYESLPGNAGGAYDRLVLGGTLVLPDGGAVRADVAINYADPVARTGGTIREVGDLADAVALDTVDASGLWIHPRDSALFGEPAAAEDAPAAAGSDGRPGAWLRIGAPARLELRRGNDPASEAVRVLAE